MELDEFVEKNIVEINDSINNFKLDKNREYTDLEIKNYLKSKLINDIYINPNLLEVILEEFKKYNYKKTKLVELANKFIYYKSDLMKIIEDTIFSELSMEIEKKKQKLVPLIVEDIFSQIDLSDGKKSYIIHDFQKVLSKSMFIASNNGFPVNLLHVNSGIMTANAGDSAQFLFLSRAILAGYNASNVDVRSSRYDTIIDYKGKLLKVQVKGISSDIISFKDRDRGGQGIDHTHERNKGKRITSKDCDIYVAVDKQVGICYLIPMYVIDSWPYEKIISVKTSDLSEYKENWKIIDTLFLN